MQSSPAFRVSGIVVDESGQPISRRDGHADGRSAQRADVRTGRQRTVGFRRAVCIEERRAWQLPDQRPVPVTMRAAGSAAERRHFHVVRQREHVHSAGRSAWSPTQTSAVSAS